MEDALEVIMEAMSNNKEDDDPSPFFEESDGCDDW